MNNFVELFLACADRAGAEKVAQVLLEKHLIACAKFLPVDSRYWWEGKIVDDKEVLLVMESVADNFDRIEAEVAKFHSYDTFVLQALPMSPVSKKAATWLQSNL